MKRIYSYDIIRVIATFVIIMFHYNCELVNSGLTPLNIFYKYKNGDFGVVGVTIFFMLSGAALFYSNYNIINLKKYYFKRFLSIYPLFWIAYLAALILRVIINKSLFMGLNPFLYFFSIIGFDGYLGYLFRNYYILGEWFLGAIIFIYLLYPLLLLFFKKSKLIYIISILIVWIALLVFNPFKIMLFRNIINCVFSFSVGMFIEYFREKIQNKAYFILSLIIIIILTIIEIDIHFLVRNLLFSLSIFIFLLNLCKKINGNKIIDFLSRTSYPNYLIHHLIISMTLSLVINNTINFFIKLALFLLLYIVIQLGSIVLLKLSQITLSFANKGSVLR